MDAKKDVLEQIGRSLFVRRDPERGPVDQLAVAVEKGTQRLQIPLLEPDDQGAVPNQLGHGGGLFLLTLTIPGKRGQGSNLVLPALPDYSASPAPTQPSPASHASRFQSRENTEGSASGPHTSAE